MKEYYRDIEASIDNRFSFFNNLRNKSVAIFGGTGYTGVWLLYVIQFLNEKYDFNIKTSVFSRNENKNLKTKFKNNVVFYCLDVLNIYELPEQYDFVINCASSPDLRQYSHNPTKLSNTIVEGTRRILDSISRQDELSNVLHLSSGYASFPDSGMQDEIVNDVELAYIKAKQYSENLCEFYRKQFSLNINIARPFSNLGPYQQLDKPWAINSFLLQAINGRPIRVMGDGNVLRSYCYGSDYAVALLILLANAEKNDCFDVGSSDSYSVLDAANLIKDILGLNAGVEVSGINSGRDFIPNTMNFVTQYGKINHFGLKEMLEKSIEWNLKQGVR
jgi:nucleoside-diphosphate-sugar epimerase